MAAREQRVQELETELQRMRVERLRDQEAVDRLRHELADRNNRLERAMVKMQELAAIVSGGHLQ
jgi:predicted  nucleic acid-binding Zn-ribbon protein